MKIPRDQAQKLVGRALDQEANGRGLAAIDQELAIARFQVHWPQGRGVNVGTDELSRRVDPVHFGRRQQRPVELGLIGVVGHHKLCQQHHQVQQQQNCRPDLGQGVFLQFLPRVHRAAALSFLGFHHTRDPEDRDRPALGLALWLRRHRRFHRFSRCQQRVIKK